MVMFAYLYPLLVGTVVESGTLRIADAISCHTRSAVIYSDCHRVGTSGEGCEKLTCFDCKTDLTLLKVEQYILVWSKLFLLCFLGRPRARS